MEMPKCPVNYEFYTSDGANCPMMLKCGHTICESCIDKILETGSNLKCPICHEIYWNKEGITKNYALCNVEYGRCIEHSLPPVKYCSAHTMCLCEECKHDGGCSLKDWAEDGFEIRDELIDKIDEIWRKLDPNSMPRTISVDYSSKKRLNHVKLLELYLRISEAAKSSKCVVCFNAATLIDPEQLSTYCETCSVTPQGKTAGVSRNRPEVFIHFISDSDDTAVQQLVGIGRKFLGKCHFHYITNEHYEALSNPSASVKDMLEVVKKVQSLIGLKQLTLLEFPDVVVCPGCRQEMKKEQLTMRKLPCTNAFHALCEGCLSGAASVVCPLDNKVFDKTGIKEEIRLPPKPVMMELPKCPPPTMPRNPPAIPSAYQTPNSQGPPQLLPRVIQPPVLQPVPSNRPDPNKLTNIGIPVPPYLGNFGCEFISKFQLLFPLPSLPEELQPLAQLCHGWPINWAGPKQQVEAMSFMIFCPVEIVGLSLGNPVQPNVSIQIEWIKLYASLATMQGEQIRVSANPNTLTGGNGYITDVYFDRPLRIQEFREHTIKLKFASLQPEVSYTVLYGGNHMSRPRDPIGSDGMSWEFMETHGIEPGESCTLQLNLAGPIIRVIYRPLSQ